MKKIYKKLIPSLILAILIMSALQVTVTTKQGVNYRVREIKLPLYLKILDFIDRHYNYKHLVTIIICDAKDDNSKTMRIFNWVTANVRQNPKELPVIDDHPLNILIRGYGVQDQFEDIFTILCTYAGLKSFFKVFKNDAGNFYYISFVKINGMWRPLSAYGGAYATKNNSIASVNEILLDHWLLEPFESKLPNFDKDYFLKELGSMDYNTTSVRVSGQSPFGRAVFVIKRFLKLN